jgi:hypothetical protein
VEVLAIELDVLRRRPQERAVEGEIPEPLHGDRYGRAGEPPEEDPPAAPPEEIGADPDAGRGHMHAKHERGAERETGQRRRRSVPFRR